MFEPLSSPLQAFLRDCISSYEELETLLLLARDSTRTWSISDIADALKVQEDVVESAVARLVDLECLSIVGPKGGRPHVEYRPARSELAEIIYELDRAYSQQRLAIVQLMSANALERLRGAAARRLADAFRIERRRKW